MPIFRFSPSSYRLIFAIAFLCMWITSSLPITQASVLGQTLTPPALQVRIEQANLLEFPLVTLDVSVRSTAGLAVRNLPMSAFQVLEGNHRLPIEQVHENDQANLAVVLVIDVSGSMAVSGSGGGQTALEDAKQAAYRFLAQLEAQDRASVIAFSDQVDTQLVDEYALTTERNVLYDYIEQLQPQGETRLYAAALAGVQALVNAPATEGHRAVVLFTDGRNDTNQPDEPQNALALAQAHNIPVFTIGLGSEIDTDYLQQLASGSGGQSRSTPRSSELAQLFSDIVSLLKHQYQIRYYSSFPASGASESVTVQVEIAGESGQGTWQLQLPLQTILSPTATLLSATPTASVPAITALPTSTVLPAPTAPVVVVAAPGLLSRLTSHLSGIILLIIGILLVAGIWRVRSRRKSPRFYCVQCGYAINQQVGACPQCGSTQTRKG